MKIKLLFLSVFLFTCLTGFTQEQDPFNTYQWNRDNIENRSPKIDTGSWYEWWYYKVVIPETNEAFYFVYGIVNPWDTSRSNTASRSYVGFGSFADKITFDEVFPITDFTSSYEETFVQIGENTATNWYLTGDISENKNTKVSWDIEIEQDWNFNAMGWGTKFRGISNIYWYPAQASAYMTGTLKINDRVIQLDRAPAYQDRNWGRSFPKWWTWLVSNHFENSPGTALALGGGKPKLLNRREMISGLCIGLRHEGKEYIFRTTDADRIKMDISFGKWEVTGINEGQKIVISAVAPKEDFLRLDFTTPSGKTFYDYEALKGTIHVELYEKKGFLPIRWNKIADLITFEGGIEYGSFQKFDE